MIALFLLAAATAADAPLKLFHDWTVGCDNGRVCEAVSLTPKDAQTGEWWSLHVSHGPAPGDAPAVSLELGEDDNVPASLVAEGRKLATRLMRDGDRVRVDPADGPALLAALRSAQKIEVADARGRSIGTISLAGASAALLYMDDRQQRVGTIGALARPGPRPASAPAPAWPVVAAARPSAAAPRALTAADGRHFSAEICGDEPDRSGRRVEAARLDAGHSLAILPASCLSGAYNDASLLLVGGASGPWRIAEVDGASEPADDPERRVLFGVQWRAGRLQSIMYGRGLGDCGGREAYVWNGTRFRLVDRSEMDECRGAIQWIRTWHAQVR